MLRKRIRNTSEAHTPVRRYPPMKRPPMAVSSRVLAGIRLDETISIPFSTTAMARPEILERTYASFTQDLEFVDFKNSTLYINIDPLPEGKDREEVIAVAEKYFGNVVANLPDTPNFTKALIWCWQKAANDPLGLFFHLEDDWILKRKVNINELRRIILAKYNCGFVNLRAYSNIGDGRLCLSPALIKSNVAKEITNVLDVRYNPERQLRKRNQINKHGGKNPPNYISVQYPSNGKLIAIEDIGRSWLDSTKYARPAGDEFITWKEK